MAMQFNHLSFAVSIMCIVFVMVAGFQDSPHLDKPDCFLSFPCPQNDGPCKKVCIEYGFPKGGVCQPNGNKCCCIGN
ncbi:LCR-like protein [Medicago truncatula]|uniref:LCR-like protein n=1 Tax=Medicago truncatula TaxID=3880 RepID=A0A072U0I3_MEDTR|nr:LCR-like protein [Medicago truncatula]